MQFLYLLAKARKFFFFSFQSCPFQNEEDQGISKNCHIRDEPLQNAQRELKMEGPLEKEPGMRLTA